MSRNNPLCGGRAALALLVVVAATVLVYLPALTNDFVGVDDDRYVTENPLIASLSGAHLWAILSRPYAEFYHPVTLLSLAFDRWLWGFNPFGYHLSDLILHVLNTVLVFWICYELVAVRSPQPAAGRMPALRQSAFAKALADKSKIRDPQSDVARTAAVIAAALFALHPLHVESVAWAAQRKDLLSAFFYLLAFGFYLHHAKHEQEHVNPKSAIRSRLWYRASLAAFLLAILSKPMVVTLPVVLVLVDYYPLRRLRSWPGRAMTRSERAVWLEKLPFLGLALAIALATVAAQRQGGALRSGAEIPWGLRPWLAVDSYAFYLWKAIVPGDLTVLYPIADVRPSNPLTWLKLAVLVAITAGAWLWRRRWPALAAGWVYYVITLAPVCGLLSFGGQSVADRYSYLPLLGPFLVVAVLVARINEMGDRGWRPTLRALVGAAAALALIALGALANRQVTFWHNGESLWRHHLGIFPNRPPALFNLGQFYHSHGRVGEAMREYQRCLQVDPHHFGANINLGSLLLRQDDAEGAAEYFRHALDVRPDHAGAHHNVGLALARLEEHEEALGHFKRAVELDPNYAEARANLGRAYAQTGNIGAAIRQYRKALSLNPRMAAVHEDLGFAYLAVDKTAEAEREFKRTLHLRPRSPAALVELGRLEAARGHPGPALEYLSKAARYWPRDAEIHLAMAKVVEDEGALGLAESALRRATEIDPDSVEAFFQLGLFLERRERYAESLEALTEAWVILQWDEKPAPQALDEALRRVDAQLKMVGPQE